MVTKREYRSDFGYWRPRVNRSKCCTDALVIFILGAGVLTFVIGPCTGLYSAGVGFVGWVAAWVVGITLRVFLLGTTGSDERDY